MMMMMRMMMRMMTTMMMTMMMMLMMIMMMISTAGECPPSRHNDHHRNQEPRDPGPTNQVPRTQALRDKRGAKEVGW
eukprot:4006085-Karenia_brevis.AAC.1